MLVVDKSPSGAIVADSKMHYLQYLLDLYGSVPNPVPNPLITDSKTINNVSSPRYISLNYVFFLMKI